MNREGGNKKSRRVLKRWQRRGLVLCLFSLLFSVILQGFRQYRSDCLPDQNEAERWAPQGGYAQVSVFFSTGAGITQDNVKELTYRIGEGLEQDSITLNEGGGGKDCLDAFSTSGALTIEHDRDSLDVDAVGVGGAFFSFHPVELVTGSYFDGDDLMKDQILIDEETAWKLFGSPDVVGQSVLIGDMTHYIAGVYRRGDNRFCESAGLNRETVFVAYKTMLQYGTVKTFSEGDIDGDTTENEYLSMTVPEGLRTGETARDTGNSTDAGPLGMLPSAAGGNVNPGRGGNDSYGYDGGGAAGGETGDWSGNPNYLPEADYSTGFSGDYSSPDYDGPSEDSGDPGISPSGEESTGSSPGGLVPGEADGGDGESTGVRPAGAGDSDRAETAFLPEGTGTQNTAFTDSGKIMCYEIVMPDPVDGYAAKMVQSKIGLDDSDYTVVENTDRFGGVSLSGGWMRFWTRSMRIGNVSYPFWENVARGWEDILSLMFLLQCLMTAVPVLYVLYLIMYYFTHKPWTLLGIIRDIQDRAYEREAARRYPELVKQLEAERKTMSA